jgi:hypothetical protein
MSEVDESKIIFFTGPPGSKWSAAAHLLTFQNIYPINTSDYTEDRIYTHDSPDMFTTSHLGAFFGPGNEFGQNFHQLHTMTKEEIIDEIDRAYEDKSWEKYRLVKCHHFSLQLDWIAETFPNSKIITITRPPQLCFRGWLGAGGFDGITYPDYKTYYETEENLEKHTWMETGHIFNFIDTHNANLNVVRRKYWFDRWGIDTTDNEEVNRYASSIEYKKDSPFAQYYTLIGEYNFDR